MAAVTWLVAGGKGACGWFGEEEGEEEAGKVASPK